MPPKLRPAADMLAELEETLAYTRVYEAPCLADGENVSGLAFNERHAIVVNPIPTVVWIILHELLHLRYPSWSERRVKRESDRLLYEMPADQQARWYRRYQRTKRKRRPVRETEML